jgi:lysophospholipase L1-like esterase
VNGEAAYLALGDSYTIGEGVAPVERWPVQLVELLRRDGLPIGDPRIIATTGWTTRDLLAGMDRARLSGPFQLVSLLIGVNNQYRGASLLEYGHELVELLSRSIELAGGQPSRVIVLSIPDWGVTPYAAARDRDAIRGDIDRFNEINMRESRRAGVCYVDITTLSRLAADDVSLLAADGLHPSGVMYERWAEQVLPLARNAFAID